MASDKHQDIRAFLEKAATGRMPAGQKMVLNTRTGKWEVRSGAERPGDNVPQVDTEDMKAFA